jgi:hypothetical protein
VFVDVKSFSGFFQNLVQKSPQIEIGPFYAAVSARKKWQFFTFLQHKLK